MKFLKACLKGDLDKIKKYFDEVDVSTRTKGLCLSIRHQRSDILDFFCSNNVSPDSILFEEENLYRFCDNLEFINKIIHSSYYTTPFLVGFLKYFLRKKKFELFLKVAQSNKIEKEPFDLYQYSIKINSLEAFNFVYNYYTFESDYRSLIDNLFYSKCLDTKDSISKDFYNTVIEKRKYNMEIVKKAVQECIYNGFYGIISYILDNYEFDDNFLYTILSESVSSGCAKCLDKLIKKGIDCSHLSNDLLKDCISKGYYKTFRILLDNGSDFSFLQGKKINLHEYSESIKILRDLKEKGINVNVDGYVFSRNIRFNFDDLKFVLDNYECPNDFIRYSFVNICEVGSREQVDYLLDKYPFLKNHISEGLCGAIASSSLDVIDYLIQVNNNIDNTVWEEVIKKGDCKVYEFFLKRFGHCSLNVFEKLIHSGKVKDWSVIRYALKEGVDINKIMPDSYSAYSGDVSKFHDFLFFLFKEGYILKVNKDKIDKLIGKFKFHIIDSLFDRSLSSENPKVIDVNEFCKH